MVCNNITTKEKLKHLFENPFGNTFNRNWKYNIYESLLPLCKKYSILDILRNGKEIKEDFNNGINDTNCADSNLNINNDLNDIIYAGKY